MAITFGEHRTCDWLTTPLVFLFHQSLGSWGAIVAAPWVLLFLGESALRFGWRTYISQTQWVVYGTPYFPAHVAIAVVIGWGLSGTFRHRCMLWIWILPLMTLSLAVIRFPLTVSPNFRFIVYPPISQPAIAQYAHVAFSARLSHFFGWGHGFQPYDQALTTLPFYCAVAYSFGALLARKVVRATRFFATVQNLRVGRLIFVVGLPWFCIKLALTWQAASGRFPVLQSPFGLEFFLTGLLVVSIFVTSVFAVGIALVGPRFALTRFFLKPDGPNEIAGAGRVMVAPN